MEISSESIDNFCKNVFNLRCVSTRTFIEERDLPASDAFSDSMQDLFDDPPQVAPIPSLTLPSYHIRSHPIPFSLPIILSDTDILVSRTQGCRPVPIKTLPLPRHKWRRGRSPHHDFLTYHVTHHVVPCTTPSCCALDFFQPSDTADAINDINLIRCYSLLGITNNASYHPISSPAPYCTDRWRLTRRMCGWGWCSSWESSGSRNYLKALHGIMQRRLCDMEEASCTIYQHW